MALARALRLLRINSESSLSLTSYQSLIVVFTVMTAKSSIGIFDQKRIVSPMNWRKLHIIRCDYQWTTGLPVLNGSLWRFCDMALLFPEGYCDDEALDSGFLGMCMDSGFDVRACGAIANE
jgi:hypothetical protein